MSLENNNIYCMDCIEGMKKLDDNSIDSIVTDPPYFLIDKTGNGFMGKDWDSLNNDWLLNILWKSKEFVKIVEWFLKQLLIELNTDGEYFVQENVNIKENKKTLLQSNVQCVEKKLKDINPKSNLNINSVQGIALTKDEVLGMLKELLPKNINVLENIKNKNDVFFVIPYTILPKPLRNIVQENVTNNIKKNSSKVKTIPVTSMEEVRIKSAIEGMTGTILEKKFIKEIIGDVEFVTENVGEKKYNVITLSHTEKNKIIQWITLLLYVSIATIRSKEDLNLSLMQTFHNAWSKEALRILKPGGFLLSFGGTRTYHRMACAIEDAGFEIRDQMQYLYGTGFPKSHNIGKALQKKGVNNEKYNKLGTALKPANEPICVARKPLAEKTVAQNVLKYGTGGINIDGCRIGFKNEDDYKESVNKNQHKDFNSNNGIRVPTKGIYNGDFRPPENYNPSQGRFPANIILDEEAGKMLDEQSGISKSNIRKISDKEDININNNIYGKGYIRQEGGQNDKGGASRFFYCAKASKKERNQGLEGLLSYEGVDKEWLINKLNQLKKDISEDMIKKVTDLEWNTIWFGNSITEQSQKDIKYITEMVINLITRLKTLNSLHHLSTKDIIQDVIKIQTMSGLNLVENVRGIKQLITTTKEKMESVLGVNLAVLEMLLIIKEKERKGNIHSTVKPVKLMEYLVRLVTPKGGIVLDPFIGSGTTGMAAKSQGFNYIGFDMTPEYVKIAEARINSVEMQKRLFYD